MRCSKCNSPLISGEPFCKICGTKVEDMPKDLEVIDLDIFDDGEEEFVNEVLENSEDEINEPISLEEIKNTPVEEEPEEVVIDLDDEKEEKMSQTLIDIMMKPIVLEDTIKLSNEDIEKEVKELKEKEEAKEEEKTEEPVEESLEDIPELPTDTSEVFKPEKKKKEIKSKEHDPINRTVKSLKPNAKGADLTVVILAVILIVSIILNVYLFVSKGNEIKPEEDGTTTIIKTNKVVFNGYELTVTNGWTVSSDEELLYLSDSSNEWVSKTFFVDDANYSDFVGNIDTFIEQMKEKRYQFTSNYEKTVDGSKLYLFKGKFDNYTTFIIVSGLTDNSVSVTEVRFENEVNDKTLDKIMSTIVSCEVTNEIYTKVDTKTVGDIVVKNSVAKEDTETEKDIEE